MPTSQLEKKTSANGRGRPVDAKKQEEQKNRLLDAAQELLKTQSYRDITIRALSTSAGINSAMVSYYFDSKEGLFHALLDRMSATHFTEMQRIATGDNPIKEFIRFILAMLNHNNGFARFIYDEFGQNHSQLGEAFLERFPKRMATILPRLILKHTSISDSQQAKLSAFTLMSMVIMPFVGSSVRQRAWNISDDLIASEYWVEHIYQLFVFGCNSSAKLNNEQ